MSLFSDARELGAKYWKVETILDKSGAYIWRDATFESPESVVSEIVSEDGHENLRHYSYSRCPHGPTEEYSPIYEMCQGALCSRFLQLWSDLNVSYPPPFGFFTMQNPRISLRFLYNKALQEARDVRSNIPNYDYINFGETSKGGKRYFPPPADIEYAICQLDNYIDFIRPDDVMRSFSEYLKNSIQNIERIVQNHEADPYGYVYRYARARERELKEMDEWIFSTAIQKFDIRVFRKILRKHGGREYFPRSEYYSKKRLETLGGANKVVGWPDITTVSNTKIALFEVKSPKDSLSPEQKEMISIIVNDLGLATTIVELSD